MKIAVIGTGYVGLVSGTCFADSGATVTCVDIDEKKIQGLRQGNVPIYEPGLSELINRNTKVGRLRFTTDLAAALAEAQIVFIAVGTPSAEDGSADLSAIFAVGDAIARHLSPRTVVVIKSTVPVGTNRRLAERLKEATGRYCEVASNPEFLKEGAAIDDFTKPDRVVVGVRTAETAEILRQLYSPFLRTEHPFIVMSPESAEMTKYVANAMLATKISFINEVANLCEHMHADVNDVRRGIGHDSRIGFAFLFPGVGYGGSCFPKDVRALAAMARSHGVEPRILDSVDVVNGFQKTILFDKVHRHFGGLLSGRTLAIWGLAFKPKTDDIREAPALSMIDRLLAQGVNLNVYDPEAATNVERQYGQQLFYAENPYQALDNADALAIMTEWKQFQNPDFDDIRRRMSSPVIFDGRNLYDPKQMRALGFTYYSIGRAPVIEGRG